MSKARRVPKKGSGVFTPAPDDARPVVLIPVGGVVLRARFPAITATRRGEVVKPVVPEVIYMADKPQVMRPFYRDPYQPTEVEPAEVDAAEAEKPLETRGAA